MDEAPRQFTLWKLLTKYILTDPKTVPTMQSDGCVPHHVTCLCEEFLDVDENGTGEDKVETYTNMSFT